MADSIITNFPCNEINRQMKMQEINGASISCESGFYIVYASSNVYGYINGNVTTSAGINAVLASALHVTVTGQNPHYPASIDIFQFQIYKENSGYTLEFIAPSYSGNKIIHDCISMIWHAAPVYLFSFK